MKQRRYINEAFRLSCSVKLERGFALLESMIGLLIFSMGVLAIIGLQGFMVKGTAEAKNRADASLIAQNRLAEIWANPTNLSGYTETEGVVVSELPNGLRTTAVTVATGVVVVTVTWQAPGEPLHTYRVNARVVGAT